MLLDKLVIKVPLVLQVQLELLVSVQQEPQDNLVQLVQQVLWDIRVLPV